MELVFIFIFLSITFYIVSPRRDAMCHAGLFSGVSFYVAAGKMSSLGQEASLKSAV